MLDQNEEFGADVLLVKLPLGYHNPQGIHMGGQWGIYIGEKLSSVHPNQVDAREILTAIGVKFKVLP